MRTSLLIDVAPQITEALQRGGPIVALESAVISHGLPHPTSLETAAALEAEVRNAGAIPATVAVIAGRIKVGATARERPGVCRDLSRAPASDEPGDRGGAGG